MANTSLGRFKKRFKESLFDAKDGDFCHLSKKRGDSNRYIIRFLSNGRLEKREADISSIDVIEYKDISDIAVTGNEEYWEQYLKILNRLSPNIDQICDPSILGLISQIAVKLLPDKSRRPAITELRKLYEQLDEDIPKILRNLFIASIEKLKHYDNKEEPLYNPNRPSKSSTPTRNTPRLQRYFEEKQKENQSVEIGGSVEYKYLACELSPLRTTKTISEDGTTGKHSGSGGIDIFCYNTKTRHPVLIEYKSKNDKSLFFALIQLLTYASELATPNQFYRMRNSWPNLDFNEDNKLELCIIYDDDERKGKEIPFLKEICTELFNKEFERYISSPILFIKNANNSGSNINLECVF